MWNEFLLKKVVIYKVDKKIKYGTLTGIEKNFIFLQFEDGNSITIAKDDIVDIKNDKRRTWCY